MPLDVAGAAATKRGEAKIDDLSQQPINQIEFDYRDTYVLHGAWELWGVSWETPGSESTSSPQKSKVGIVIDIL